MTVIGRDRLKIRVCPVCGSTHQTREVCEGVSMRQPHERANTRKVWYVRADLHAGAVEAFARERQAVLDVVNLYGDATLHKALEDIGWPATPRGGQ